jgi:ubiquinone/menaquinone biosynthesis C-methylase UbiE
MERLCFSDTTPYSGLEAAVHLGRYSIVRSLCPGRRVLDVACGEGYGSDFMSRWGAKHVDGVDSSAEAIATSRKLFGSETVFFTQGRAEQVDEIFSTRSFDLIVALETVEHVEDPDRFLMALCRLQSREGVIVISCPNDWWYYPAANQSNPHHRRKYRFDEFRKASEVVLGQAIAWYLGGPVSGFANVHLDGFESASAESTQLLMSRSRELPHAFLLPAEYKMGPAPTTCSYFVGIWGEVPDLTSATILPLSMNSFRDGAFSAWGPGEVGKLNSEKERLSEALAEQGRQLAEQTKIVSDLSSEAERVKTEAERLSLRFAVAETEKQRLLLDIARMSAREDQLKSMTAAFENAEAEKDSIMRQLQDLERQHRKVLMQLHALAEERVVLRRNLAANAGLAESGDPATMTVDPMMETAAADLANLRSRLAVVEAEAELYRKIRSLIPPWLMPVVRRVGQAVL